MDSVKCVEESDVSDPLKHLLSLDWESTATATKSKDIQNGSEQSKNLKKVRFSDEVKEFPYDDTSEENISLSIFEKCEKVKNNHSFSTQLNADVYEVSNQNDGNLGVNSKVEMPCTCDDDRTDYLMNRNEITSELINLNNEYIVDLRMQDSEASNIEKRICLQSEYAGLEDTSDVLETDVYDLNDLATQIENISIQPTHCSNVLNNQASEKMLSVSSDKASYQDSEIHSSCTGDYASDSLLPTNRHPCSEARFKQRINQKKEFCNRKQSWKLNSALKKDLNVSNASELKSAVFKAWYKVKDKTKADTESTTSNKTYEHVQSASKHAYMLWKKSKIKALKTESKGKSKSITTPHISQEINKTDEEEREMAFKLWKKRKDAIMKKTSIDEKIKERQHNLTSLMNEKEKREDAEAAFFAWKEHKSHIMKIEKKKKAWLLHKEKEEAVKKSLRDKEALQMYYLWLETKHFPGEKNTSNTMQAKLSWIPPGKSSI